MIITTMTILVLMLFAITAAAQTTLEQGRTALAQGDIDTAVNLLQKAVDEQPDSADAHYWLGDAYGRAALKASIFRRMSLARKTRAEFERAVALNPDGIDARFALVQFYTMAPSFLGGSTAKALDQAAEIAARNPEKGKIAVAFVQTHGRSGDMPQSVPRDSTVVQSSRAHH